MLSQPILFQPKIWERKCVCVLKIGPEQLSAEHLNVFSRFKVETNLLTIKYTLKTMQTVSLQG